jgi:hypothetical protein
LINESRLAALPSILLREVRSFFPEDTFRAYFTKLPPWIDLVVEFPGQHEFGNIRVEASEMNDEITVYLGYFYHTHFTWYRDIEPSREAGYNQLVSEALDFIRRFMCGELILKVIFLFKREISASVFDAKKPACHSPAQARRTQGFFRRILGLGPRQGAVGRLGVWEVRKYAWIGRPNSR